MTEAVSEAQRAYAASLLAYRLAQQHAERVGDLYAQAAHMAEVLRGRMEEARRALHAEQN